MQSNSTPGGEVGREPWRHTSAAETTWLLKSNSAPQASSLGTQSFCSHHAGCGDLTAQGQKVPECLCTSASSSDDLLRIRILKELLSVKCFGQGPIHSEYLLSHRHYYLYSFVLWEFVGKYVNFLLFWMFRNTWA